MKKVKKRMTRRSFLATSFAVSSFLASPVIIPRSALAQDKRPGANDRIGVAIIGVGRRGSSVAQEAFQDSRVVPVGVCDVWKDRAKKFAAKFDIPFVTGDYREIIDLKQTDAIITATPEHWRSLICVNAALASQHLYVEKPVTLTVEDGKAIRKAVRKTGIIFQSGSQQRSMRENYLGCQLIREGHLGKIQEIIAANYESPWLCDFPEEAIPDGLDWNMWCGPNQPIPFHRQIFIPRGNPGWLSLRPWSGGEMTGWGCHGFDQIQCALGKDLSGPVEFIVEGKKLVPPVYVNSESPKRGNDLCCRPQLSFRYENGPIVRLGKSNRGGAVFIGEKGKMEIFRGRIVSNPPEIALEYLKEHAEVGVSSHMTNWLDCIISKKVPRAEMETGIRTADICHLLNIARYTGHNLNWDPVSETITNFPEANVWLSREHRKGFELPHY